MLMCRPAIIVRPYSAEDVAIVVTFAVRHGFQVTTFTQQSGIVLKYILQNYCCTDSNIKISNQLHIVLVHKTLWQNFPALSRNAQLPLFPSL